METTNRYMTKTESGAYHLTLVNGSSIWMNQNGINRFWSYSGTQPQVDYLLLSGGSLRI